MNLWGLKQYKRHSYGPSLPSLLLLGEGRERERERREVTTVDNTDDVSVQITPKPTCAFHLFYAFLFILFLFLINYFIFW